MTDPVELRFVASASAGEVSALLERPTDARALYVMGHGAGAGMRHAFMTAVSGALAARGIATFRYQFPYVEARRARPDPPAILWATVRSAIATATSVAPGLPVFAGGKSMGGRMTSQAFADRPLDVLGLAFFGFPLHPTGAPATVRAEHLERVTAPMLFLQGTRDDLARLDLLQPVIDRLGARATLHVVEGAEHSFHVLKRSGRTDADVLEELADTMAAWSSTLVGAAGERR